MQAYDKIRQSYKPSNIKVLLIAESPPPPPNEQSSRQFYYAERIRKDDRLFNNTIWALYPEAAELSEAALQANKKDWLKRFKKDGYYMVEALEESQVHEVTKHQRQTLIQQTLPDLISRLKRLCSKQTKIILIKSNVFEVAAEPLKAAGFNVINTGPVDYPGRFNQRAYRQKLAMLLNEDS